MSFVPILFTIPATGVAGAYIPDVDRVLLAVGQNVTCVTDYVAAVGGSLGGVMSYTSTANMEGLTVGIDYGSGLIDAQYFVNSPAYSNSVLQIGLYINGDLANIISGVRDANITTIGNWIKSTGRPVYLRIGYEFDGPWNALPPNQYVPAYQHIVDVLRADGVTNAAYVWHSSCSPTYDGYPISAWYPGDNYVDWAGISVFQQFAGALGTMADIDNFCAFAKSRNKPIMIAESTPYGGISDARWTNWFLPCLNLIQRHHIQLWCYIDANWEAEPMFAGQGWGDCRIEENPFVMSNWLAAVQAPRFLNEGSHLYPRLHSDATNCWLEAESAVLSGVSIYSDPAASGGAAVTGLSSPGCSVTFTNSGAAQQFILHYSANSPGTLGLYVNSQPRRTLPIAATGGTYADLLIHAPIPAGATVTLQFDSGDVSVNLDSILFRGYANALGDGIPDDWKSWRLGSANARAGDDPDGDGSPNYAEWAADTDPLDAASVLRDSTIAVSSGAATITFVPPENRTCFVQQSSDMKHWTYAPKSVLTNLAFASVTVTNLAPGATLRLSVP